MKKILTLSLIALSLFSFKINAVEQIVAPLSVQNQISKQNKGFFEERQDRFLAKKFKKKTHTPKAYIEPKQCSMLTAVCASFGSFIAGIFIGFGTISGILYAIFHA